MTTPEELEAWMAEAFKQANHYPAIKGFSVNLDTMSLIPTSRCSNPVCCGNPVFSVSSKSAAQSSSVSEDRLCPEQ